MERGLILGVDGGGTRTLAIAATQDGIILARAEGAGINYHNMGMDQARQNLRQVVSQLLEGCGQPAFAHMIVGMSALDAAADGETLRSFAGDVFQAERLDMQSDAYTALMGATLGAPGMIAICGTGSILLMLDEKGSQHVRCGWGHILGDLCSSYSLAVAGLRAVIAQWEAAGPPTSLTDRAVDYYHLSRPRALIDAIYSPTPAPDRIAQFARVVLEEAEAGDEQALAILNRNLSALAGQIVRLAQAHPRAARLALYGGVFQHHPGIIDKLTALVHEALPDMSVALPEYPPEVGALIHYYKQQRTLTPQTLTRLKESYKELTAHVSL